MIVLAESLEEYFRFFRCRENIVEQRHQGIDFVIRDTLPRSFFPWRQLTLLHQILTEFNIGSDVLFLGLLRRRGSSP